VPHLVSLTPKTSGATSLLNWTEAGPKIAVTSQDLRNRARFASISAWHSSLERFGSQPIRSKIEVPHLVSLTQGSERFLPFNLRPKVFLICTGRSTCYVPQPR